jgi:hypothetical protein
VATSVRSLWGHGFKSCSAIVLSYTIGRRGLRRPSHAAPGPRLRRLAVHFVNAATMKGGQEGWAAGGVDGAMMFGPELACCRFVIRQFLVAGILVAEGEGMGCAGANACPAWAPGNSVRRTMRAMIATMASTAARIIRKRRMRPLRLSGMVPVRTNLNEGPYTTAVQRSNGKSHATLPNGIQESRRRRLASILL